MAHKIDVKPRTGDVLINENVDFAGLLLSDSVLLGLKEAGFQRPSPIQLKAVPLGRCGLDLIVQAKSGTGKTAVFVIIALENILLESPGTQVIVLAPTREIAVQIWEVFKMVGSHMPALRCHTFIGGLPVAEDKQKLKKCHIAVGTPGRIRQLIEEQVLRTESVRLFILDEADKLMEDNFQDQINWIYSTLPENKQMLALSATYPEILAQHLTAYMRHPTFMRLNTSDPALLGIRQYYKKVKFHPLPQKANENKAKSLLELLSSVAFHQCLVFSNYQLRAQSLSDQLNAQGWPSTYISGNQDQKHRLQAMAKLKTLQCRVLISTDLTARGIDAEHVNLVVNLDVPWDHETYLHRIGRAGRFGTYGAAVTLTCEGKEFQELRIIEDKCNTHIMPLPDPIPNDLAKSSGYVNLDDLVSTEQLHTDPSALLDLYVKPPNEGAEEATGGEDPTKNFPKPQLPPENGACNDEPSLFALQDSIEDDIDSSKQANLSVEFPKKYPSTIPFANTKIGGRVRHSSPPTDSSSMNDHLENKHSPRHSRRRKKTKGKGSPLHESSKENRPENHLQPQEVKTEDSFVDTWQPEERKYPKNALKEPYIAQGQILPHNETLIPRSTMLSSRGVLSEFKIQTLAQKLKGRKQHKTCSYQEAMENFQAYMKSDCQDPSKISGDLTEQTEDEEGDAVANEILALAAEEEHKELVRKVGQFLEDIALVENSGISCKVRPSDSGIVMDASTEMLEHWEYTAQEKFNEGSGLVSVGVNTSCVSPNVGVNADNSNICHGGARPKTHTFDKTKTPDPFIANTVIYPEANQRTSSKDVQNQSAIPLQSTFYNSSVGYVDLLASNRSGRLETSDLDETDTTEDSESDSSDNVRSTGDQCGEGTVNVPGEAQSQNYEHNEPDAEQYHNYSYQDPEHYREYYYQYSDEYHDYTYQYPEDAKEDNIHGDYKQTLNYPGNEEWEQGYNNDSQKYGYRNGNYANPSTNHKDSTAANGVPAQAQSNPYWLMAAWQSYYWMAACSAAANPEQFYYQNYVTYSQYASQCRDLYQQSNMNRRLLDIHKAQRQYINHMAKSVKELNG